MPILTDIGEAEHYYNPNSVVSIEETVIAEMEEPPVTTIVTEDSTAVGLNIDFTTVLDAIRNTQDPNSLLPLFTTVTGSKTIWVNPCQVSHVEPGANTSIKCGDAVEITVTDSFATVTVPLLIWENWAR